MLELIEQKKMKRRPSNGVKKLSNKVILMLKIYLMKYKISLMKYKLSVSTKKQLRKAMSMLNIVLVLAITADQAQKKIKRKL